MTNIQVEHLTKRFGPLAAVDDLSFTGPARRRFGMGLSDLDVVVEHRDRGDDILVELVRPRGVESVPAQPRRGRAALFVSLR